MDAERPWRHSHAERSSLYTSQAEKSRHFGRDAEIQAMDGIQPVAQVLDSDHLPTYSFLSFDTGTLIAASSLPSLDAGFRHP